MNLIVDIDDRRVREALAHMPGAISVSVSGWVRQTTGRAGDNAKHEAPQRTSQLQTSIRSVYTGLYKAVVKPNVKYAEPVHEGSGLYGPKKRRITPKNAKALRFTINGRQVFAKSTKGQKPNRFMDRAYKVTKPVAERDAKNILDSVMKRI